MMKKILLFLLSVSFFLFAVIVYLYCSMTDLAVAFCQKMFLEITAPGSGLGTLLIF
jgi:hypothetical protein